MLHGLRLRLTLLYLLAALVFLAGLGLSCYWLLGYYFQATTDLALQHRMAHEFRRRGRALPPELAAADRAWYANHNRLLPAVPAFAPPHTRREQYTDEDEEYDEDHAAPQAHTIPADANRRAEDLAQEIYDGELAAIFALPLAADGRVLGTEGAPLFLTRDPQLLATALSNGRDLRTVALADGTRLRLLTYPLPGPDQQAWLQLGRTLTDQDRIRGQLLGGLLGLGIACVLLVGTGSWWLAGRSLKPAQQAWTQQQTFVANASHELRTPLTLMRASAEVALRRVAPDDAETRELLHDLVQECDHMTRLVADLLLLSRLDAGRLQLERAAVPTAALLDGVRRQVTPLATRRGVTLNTHSDDSSVWGDVTRLRQVLLILLDNALRHTPAGGSIELTAAMQGRRVQLAVRDSGCGIAAEHLPHIFERFYQADTARGASDGGAGLGLPIAKLLIAAQHGQIALSSTPGQGTLVTISLPAVGSVVA